MLCTSKIAEQRTNTCLQQTGRLYKHLYLLGGIAVHFDLIKLVVNT